MPTRVEQLVGLTRVLKWKGSVDLWLDLPRFHVWPHMLLELGNERGFLRIGTRPQRRADVGGPVLDFV